jgi:hypothetical protein
MDIMRRNGQGLQYLESLVNDLDHWKGFNPPVADKK